jgi:hypothetical protein
LAAISEALGSGIENVLKNHVQGASVEVLLAFALYVDTNQFRNTYNVTNRLLKFG